MIDFKEQSIIHTLIGGIVILALLYVVEQNAILGDKKMFSHQKTLVKELSLANQEILRGAGVAHLEERLEAVGDVLRLERVKEFSFLEPSPSEFSLTPKRYE